MTCAISETCPPKTIIISYFPSSFDLTFISYSYLLASSQIISWVASHNFEAKLKRKLSPMILLVKVRDHCTRHHLITHNNMHHVIRCRTFFSSPENFPKISFKGHSSLSNVCECYRTFPNNIAKNAVVAQDFFLLLTNKFQLSESHLRTTALRIAHFFHILTTPSCFNAYFVTLKAAMTIVNVNAL